MLSVASLTSFNFTYETILFNSRVNF